MNHRPIRIALVMNHPAQHFTRALQLLSEETDLQVHVYYWSVPNRFHDPGFGRTITWDIDLLAGYAWAAPMPGKSAVGKFRWVAGQLRAMRPDVVISYGWASPIARMSIIYCVLARIRVLLYGDSTWQHSIRGRHRVSRWLLLRILMHLCSGAVSTGVFNREFYIRNGMNPRQIFSGVCPADTEMFERAHNDNQRAAQAGHRELRIGFAGKLIAQKGVDELLKASAGH
jgi:glycosyltransferase involved in cell wall biosynthesis